MIERPSPNNMTREEKADKAEIDALVRSFFQLFSNRAGIRPELDRIFGLFVPRGLLVKCGGEEPEVCSLIEFITPRQALLTNGTLQEFHEFETGESTTIFGDCAQRISAYQKSGVLDGQVFSTRGVKTFQFVRSGAGWKILSVAWDDERNGFQPA